MTRRIPDSPELRSATYGFHFFVDQLYMGLPGLCTKRPEELWPLFCAQRLIECKAALKAILERTQ